MRTAILIGLFVLASSLAGSGPASAAVSKEQALESTVNVLGMKPLLDSGEIRASVIEDESAWPPFGDKYKGKAWLVAVDWIADPPETQHYWIDRETGRLLETT